MLNLDDKGAIKALDPKELDTSLMHFADQVKAGYDTVDAMDLPKSFKDFENVVVTAMGGSRLAAVVIAAVFKSKIKVPFSYFASYDLPAYVNSKSLVVAISTSGTTEETLSGYADAKKKSAAIFAMTTGGKLDELCKQDGNPVYIIDDHEFNPARVPRVGAGFQIGALLAVLKRAGVIDFDVAELNSIVPKLKKRTETLAVAAPTATNNAKSLAVKALGKVGVIIASEHLWGAANVINNQYNESGKNLSCFFELPEVNHHQLEGMKYPVSNPQNLLYVLLESDTYHPRIIKRYEILKSILDDLGISWLSIKANGESAFEQSLDLVQFGGFFTYYMGLANGEDPAPNPFVDKFKALLGK